PNNIRDVASGGSEFCLTSVAHYLAARAEWGHLAARFVAVVSQRSPIAALVRSDSDLVVPPDLAGRSVGGPVGTGGALMSQYYAGLAYLGLAAPAVVSMDYLDAPVALGLGKIDAIADYCDLVPRMRRLAGVDLRAVPLGIEVYSSGLVAADRVSDADVDQMRGAIRAALVRQRENPRAGLEQMLARYPEHDPDDVVESWELAEPNIFTGVEVGSMDRSRWDATLDHLCLALDLPRPASDTVHRWRADMAVSK
ncbi:MAG: ABC transporter substrate-binding protein, partial [Pseudonocardiaceae bacterium]